MSVSNPLQKTKEEYESLIEHLSSPNSPVGIDAQYTHAIIIEYLKQIDERLQRLEARLADEKDR